jgi:hypothetical protein
MNMPRLRTLALAAVASIGLSACTYGDYGYGYGYGGFGYGGYYDPYYYPSYYGWYDDFYYPGIGFYVYDHHGHRHHWSDSQRQYWESHRDHNWSGSGTGYHNGGNWTGGNWSGGHGTGGNWSGGHGGGNWGGDHGSGDHSSWHNRAAERAAQAPQGSPERQSLENYVRQHGTDWRGYGRHH